MKKIRINELARELEVKPNIILDMLPELGVQEKKTHSSSIDEDVAITLKRRLAGYTDARDDESQAPEDREKVERVTIDTVEIPVDVPTARAEEAAPAAPSSRPAAPAPAPAEATAENTPAASAAETANAPADGNRPAAPAGVSRSAPLRPPLAIPRPSAGGNAPEAPVAAAPPAPPAAPAPVAPPAAPAAVVPPPVQVAPPTPAPPAPPVAQPAPPAPTPAVPAPPAARTPAQPQAPSRPAGPGAPSQPSRPLPPSSGPARGVPIGPTRPGQILSGPRQPLPPGMSEPARPTVTPGTPRPAPTIPRPPVASRPAGPGAPPPPRPAGPPPSAGQGQPLPPPQPQGNRPALAGQPAARPVVPPRPDLVEKLRQQARSAPGAPAPAPPRPGMPTRPQASPVPGQPIYRGPIRPGQPLPGRPVPGAPAGPGARTGRPGGRPMHPTSPGRMEPPPPAPTDTRRNQHNKGGRPVIDRERELERRERDLRPQHRRQEAFVPPPINREITISDGITVKELSEKLGVKSVLVMKKLMDRKIFATINQTLDTKMAEDLARDFGASTNKVSFEQEATQDVELNEDPKELVRRAPVVTIMGHVDHGKTSLLDAIRQTNVAGREAGGITQHIGAYRVEKNGRKIVFIDTPGHEAFTRMRARGAKVTDIVILVVGADDGVMPQTIEAINHAKAANVPIVVAINKIDKPDAQPARIAQQLADRGLLAEEFGGDTPMVRVSARTKEGLEDLLEIILLVADLQDLKANPNRPAVGNVLEAKVDKGRGPVATVLVRNGKLKVGDFFICGAVFGKVRAMFDDRGGPVREAEPSMPVEVLGLDSLPDVGDTFQVVTDTAKAKQIVIYREAKARDQQMARGARMSLDQLSASLKEGEVKELLIVLKADFSGTIEVLSDTLQKLSNEKVKIRILSSGVGAISESDVLLASASEAIIVGFSVRPERNAQALADKEKVEIRLHSIIYDLVDEIKKAMTGMLEPVYREVYKGRAQVREVFRITKVGTVAGCMVIDGTLTRNSEARLIRENAVVHTGKIDTLKRFKDDVSEVRTGFECGVSIANYNDLKPGDVIEAFITERVAAEALV